MKNMNGFIRAGVTGIFFVLFVTGRLPAQPDTLSFLHISDIHLIFDLEKFQPNLAETRKHYANGAELFKDFLKKVPARTGAEFVVVTGDLVDFSEGETTGGEMSGWLITRLSKLVKKQKNKLLFTLGNHDVAAYSWGDSSRVSSQENAGKSRARWIQSVSCFSQGTYYSRTVKVGKTTYQLIFLDNSYNTVGKNESISVPFISREQQHWLEARFSDSPDDVEIVLMHIPMNPGIAGFIDNNSVYSVCSRQSSLKLFLVGHNHRSEMKEFQNAESHFYQVQTGAFAQDIKNWRLIRLTEDNILVSVTGDVKTEVMIPVN
jgi:3',5'-cyclic AMP phosphodiesterase CpdA